ncbi:MAG: sialidase family protein [Actinomycetaceae bacterium]|nr:sialidase family protein [Actinomycetaceae bacterium]
MRDPITLATDSQGKQYSLPSLRRSPGRTLVTAYECYDSSTNEYAIYVRTSCKHGFEWNAPQKVLGKDCGPHLPDEWTQSVLQGKDILGYSRPSFIIDMMTGRITLMSSVVFAQDKDDHVLYMVASSSDDEGETWQHCDVTTQVTGASEWCMKYGFPGHGIQLRQGVLTGRLIQPASIVDSEGKRKFVALCSDDQGITWWTSQPAGNDIDGAGLIELSDGQLMIKSGGIGRCLRIFSQDGGRTWVNPLIEEGEDHSLCSSAVDRVFPCAPPASQQAKCAAYPTLAPDTHTIATVRGSFDDGKTWTVSEDFAYGPVRHPDICAMPDLRLIALVYESGEGIDFTHICLDDLEMRDLAYGWNERTRDQDDMLREMGFIS